VQSLLNGRHIGAVGREAQTAFNLLVALPAAHATRTSRTMPAARITAGCRFAAINPSRPQGRPPKQRRWQQWPKAAAANRQAIPGIND
jgi:hypothetical protein